MTKPESEYEHCPHCGTRHHMTVEYGSHLSACRECGKKFFVEVIYPPPLFKLYKIVETNDKT